MNYLKLVDSYTLTLNANGGTIQQSTFKMWKGQSNNNILSEARPVKANYAFTGWFTAASGGTMVFDAACKYVNDGTYWSAGKWVYNKDTTLYAHWEPLDKDAPQIIEAYVDHVTATGYDVYVTAKDPSGISDFWFETWNDAIGIGNAEWQYTSDATIIASTDVLMTVKVHVSTAVFDKKTNTNYYTNVYVTDGIGNRTADSAVKRVTCYVLDGTPPAISDIRIDNRSAKGYTISCIVTAAGQITRVQFPTWSDLHSIDQVDPLWGDSEFSRGTQGADGRWYFNVDINNGHFGDVNCNYYTHIYAWDADGHYTCDGYGIYVDATPPVISDVKIIERDSTGYTVSCIVTDNGEVKKVGFPTWTIANDQDDRTWD